MSKYPDKKIYQIWKDVDVRSNSKIYTLKYSGPFESSVNKIYEHARCTLSIQQLFNLTFHSCPCPHFVASLTVETYDTSS